MAAHYSDHVEREKVMAITMSGYGLGIVMGPTFGGITYQHLGKGFPFLLLSSVAIVDAVLQVKFYLLV